MVLFRTDEQVQQINLKKVLGKMDQQEKKKSLKLMKNVKELPTHYVIWPHR